MAEHNDHFEGNKLNDNKMVQYVRLRDAIKKWASEHEDEEYNHYKVVEEEPDPSRYYSNIHLFTGNPFGLKASTMTELLSTISIADEFTIYSDNDDIIQLSWTIFDVWEESDPYDGDDEED